MTEPITDHAGSTREGLPIGSRVRTRWGIYATVAPSDYLRQEEVNVMFDHTGVTVPIRSSLLEIVSLAP